MSKRSKIKKLYTTAKGEQVSQTGAKRGSPYVKTDAQGRHTSQPKKAVEARLKPTTTTSKTTPNTPSTKVKTRGQVAQSHSKMPSTTTTPKQPINMGNAQVVAKKLLPAPAKKVAAAVGGAAGALAGVAVNTIGAYIERSNQMLANFDAAQGSKAAKNIPTPLKIDHSKGYGAPKYKPSELATTPPKTTPVKTAPAKKKVSEFGSAFADARKAGKKEFDFGGKKYHTRTAEEDRRFKAAKAQKPKTSEPYISWTWD